MEIGKNGNVLFKLVSPLKKNFLEGIIVYHVYFSFKVLIHDPDEFPGPQSTTRLISINKLSFVQLFGTKMTCSNDVKNLPITQRHCLYPGETVERGFGGNFFSGPNCLMECEANQYFGQCGCIPYYFSFSGKN